eukprot:73506-Chlamydomonas_euryale.AAC.8
MVEASSVAGRVNTWPTTAPRWRSWPVQPLISVRQTACIQPTGHTRVLCRVFYLRQGVVRREGALVKGRAALTPKPAAWPARRLRRPLRPGRSDCRHCGAARRSARRRPSCLHAPVVLLPFW